MPLWKKVSKIDAFFQNSSDKFTVKAGEKIADRYYEDTGEGWEKVSEKNLKMAYNEYKNLLIANDIEEETALNY